MLITLEKLRQIKRNLPSGAIWQIAKELNTEVQQVEDFFEGNSASNSQPNKWHSPVGPSRDIFQIENPIILQYAKKLILESQKIITESSITIKESRKLLR